MKLDVFKECWSLKEPFVISRGTQTKTEVIKVELNSDGLTGRGECVPSPRYGESTNSTYSQIQSVTESIENGISRLELLNLLPPGAARNALDCALWDLEAKQSQKSVSELLNYPYPDNIYSVQTVSIGSPLEMAEAAAKLSGFQMLKIKIDADNVVNRIRQIHKVVPNLRLILDANESWSIEQLKEFTPQLVDLGVVMIEQPLPANKDEQLANYQSELPLAADESCHTTLDVDRLVDLYDVVNIKLDKTGGLTEAIRLADSAEKKGMGIMIGCMLGTSLSMAPALVLATRAEYVDLDAPALLSTDRKHGLTLHNGRLSRLDENLWGG